VLKEAARLAYNIAKHEVDRLNVGVRSASSSSRYASKPASDVTTDPRN
jgi:hypothetical protein